MINRELARAIEKLTARKCAEKCKEIRNDALAVNLENYDRIATGANSCAEAILKEIGE